MSKEEIKKQSSKLKDRLVWLLENIDKTDFRTLAACVLDIGQANSDLQVALEGLFMESKD